MAQGLSKGEDIVLCLWTNRSWQLEWTSAVGLKISGQFFPGGGTVNDGGAQVNLWLRPDLSVTASVQYERGNFPVLTAGAQTNVKSTVPLTFWLRWWVR